MPKVPQQAVRDLAASLEQAAGRSRTAIRREFAAAYGCSNSTLSRMLNEVGYKERTRSDAGTRRVDVADPVLMRLAAIQRASLSARKGVVMPAEDAINIAEDSGLLERGAVSTSWYNEWLRDREASRRQQDQAEPHIRLRSLGPNHVHQVDFSLAVNWKIFQGRPIYEHLVYKNKLPAAGVPRLWRLIVVDHATGVLYPSYSESTGETVQATLEGLYRAWSPKTLRGESVEALYPFRGVPRILMADRGSANQAKVTSTVLERLGVQLHICNGARSKGLVEVSHRFWEEHFESRMRLQTPASVEQLNEWALDFAIKICATKVHTRFGATRTAMWAWHINRREESKLREIRCDFETFKAIALSDTHRCLVRGDRTIRFKSHRYRVPAELEIGRYVTVQFSVFDFPAIVVRDAENESGPAWECQPIEVDEFGQALNSPIIGQEYKSHKATATKRFVSEAEEIKDGYVEQQNLKVFGHHAQSVRPTAIKHRGSDVLQTPDPQTIHIPAVQARLEVKDAIARPLTPAEADYLHSVWGETVTNAQIDQAIQDITSGIAARVLPWRKAGGDQ